MIDAVLDALRQVIDPELDESIVELGFVDHVNVRDEAVEVVLRLPTFMCAPNFAYLMAADAREAVLALPGIRSVQVKLRDHMYSDEISVGVSCGESFSQTFAGQTEDDDLEGLRRIFWTKAFGMRQEQLVRFLLDVGLSPHEIVALRPDSDLPRGGAPLMRTYLERRARLGLQGALITDAEGQPVRADDLEEHLRNTRRSRVSMTFNSLMCKGLLETRYDLAPARKEDAR
jgi:metal-sulfur cluster biosynthetic enzyme